MICGNNIRDHDVVGVMELVLITAITKNRQPFSVYFRVTSTPIKHNCNKTHECNCCTQQNERVHAKIVLTKNLVRLLTNTTFN